jgi:integrase
MKQRSPGPHLRGSKRRPEGVQLRHARGCGSRSGGACSCSPSYQAQVFSQRDRRTIRKSFPTLAEARAWRQETQVALRRATLLAPSRITLAEAARGWLAAARAGVVRTRSGERYKPSALRSYARALETKVLPRLGQLRLSALTRNDVQDLVDRLVASGRAPSTVRNSILPLRAIYRRAVSRSEVAVNPTLKLALPAVRGARERVARPREAEALIEALAAPDRALWATALYAGLRRGELLALGWDDLDLEGRLLRVERSWDRVAGAIEPKSRAGRRRVPISETLRSYLLAHRLLQGRGRAGLVFGGPERPLDPTAALERARAAWRRAGLEPIGLHESRHTYAAFMIAAGVSAKALQRYMGHSSISVTLDRYGHLLPGNEAEAAGMLDRYLAREAR